MRAFGDADWMVRDTAAKALVKIGERNIIDPLIRLLKDQDPERRRLAALTLARFGAVDPLSRALTAKDPKTRGVAVTALAELSNPRSTALLTQALRDGHPHVRLQAVRVLWHRGGSSALRPLLQALQDNDAEVRGMAAVALGNMRDTGAIAALASTLRDRDRKVRRKAARALQKFADPQIVAGLIHIIRDEDLDFGWNMRIGAGAALGELGTPAMEPLILLLEERDPGARLLASEVLGKLGDRRAVTALVRLLQDEHMKVRVAAAKALRAIKDPRAIKALIYASWEEVGYNRIQWSLYSIIGDFLTGTVPMRYWRYKPTSGTIKALKRLDDRTTVDQLNAALRNEDIMVCMVAAIEFGRRGALQPLIQAITADNLVLRKVALSAMAEFGADRAVEPLIRVLSGNDWPLRKDAAMALGRIGDTRAVDRLIHVLQGIDWTLHEAAAEALGKIGDVRAIAPLSNALRVGAIELQETAVKALGQIGGQNTIAPLFEVIMNNSCPFESAFDALEVSGAFSNPRVIAVLAKASKNPKRYRVERLNSLLARIEYPHAPPVLRHLLPKRDPKMTKAPAGTDMAVPLIKLLDDSEAETYLATVKMGLQLKAVHA